MKITTLNERPDKYGEVLKLIHECFRYDRTNNFAIDFFPLMKPENHRNCCIVLDDQDRVLGHAAVNERCFSFKETSHPVLLIGGVCVAPNARGKGLLHQLMRYIFRAYPHYALHILWSEKNEMYQQYRFYPCMQLIELDQTLGKSETFEQRKFHLLSQSEKSQIRQIYHNAGELRVHRNDSHWHDIENIKSSDLFIKRSCSDRDKIENYFFMNKGQDLTGIIHEYGSLEDLNDMRHYGKIWAIGEELKEFGQTLYGALFRIADPLLFKSFVEALTDKKILIQEIDEFVDFEFQGRNYHSYHMEFLQGIFGPGHFKELLPLPSLFISGLDSV